MEALVLARLQFAVTTIYHYLFVPLTLGLGVLVAIMQTQYVRTGDESYKRMTKFWGKLFLINFAMGVVTGIVQEFQFGMAWSEYSRFVGDIFGAPLAIEALMAFFIESTFLGIWIFGWDKLPKKVHLFSIWMVAIAANVSALWILIANSFMQNPVGYEIIDGRAQMTDFFALITNPNIFVQYPHVVLAAFATAGFFVIGISAYRLLRTHTEEEGVMFRRSLRLGLVFGLASIMFAMGAGHYQGQFMLEKQPMKLAAAEGLWETEDPAALSFFQIGDEVNRTSIINIRIPSLLSFLTYDSFEGEVPGINPLNEMYIEQFAEQYGDEYAEQYGLESIDFVPPMIWLNYWSFRAMVGAGMAMAGLSALGLLLVWLGQLEKQRWFLRVLVLAIALPYLANTTGWILGEVGRQPWIVQGLMRVEEAVSPMLTATTLLISLIGFTLLYTVLAAANVYLLAKYATGDSQGNILPDTSPEAADDLTLGQAY